MPSPWGRVQPRSQLLRPLVSSFLGSSGPSALSSSWPCLQGLLEKEMAPHSSTLSWRIPWTEEPGGVHGVATSRTRLSDFTFTLEKEMATHSSILAWKIPWTGEPGRLQSMGRQRVRRDCATSSLHSTSLSGRQWQGSFFLDQWDSESGPIAVRNPVGRAGHTHSRCSLLEGLKSLDLEPRRPSVVT